MIKLSQAIDKTIDYSQRFGGKLTIEQLRTRLLSSRVYSTKEIEREVKLKKINLKKVVSDLSNKKIDYAKRVLAELSKWPEILLVGVTGSVAADNAELSDDIDILIIVKNNCLWSSRLALKWWLKRHKIDHRSYYQKEQKDDFCFNLWLDETNLVIPKKRQTLQNAIDLVMMKVIFDRDGCYDKFLLANGWAKKYVATGYWSKISNYKCQITNKKQEVNLFDIILNWICYLGQRIYMHGRIGKGEVGIDKAFFYP